MFPKFLLPLLLGLSLPACGLSGGPIEGAILEEGTRKPIPGVIVVVRWLHHQGYSGTVCYRVESAVSNETGRFQIARWSNASDHRALRNPWTSIDFYATAFERAGQTDKDIYVRSVSGGKEERLKELLRLLGATRCGDGGSSEKNRLPLLRALLAEARTLTGTQYDRETIETFLFELEILELGYETASDRQSERLAKQRSAPHPLAIGATDPMPAAFVSKSQHNESEPPQKQD